MEPENKEASAEEQKELSLEEKLAELLKDFEGSPSTTQIEAWKQTHGDVFATAFSEKEFFVFRAVSRSEYKRIQEEVGKSNDPDLFETLAIQNCLLWSSVSVDAKAGTVPTLCEQIMQQSNFMPPEAAAQLVIKL